MTRLLAALALIVPTAAQAGMQLCVDTAGIAATIDAGTMRLVAEAIDDDGNLIRVVVLSGGEWAMWQTAPNAPRSCTVLMGTDFRAIAPPPVLTGRAM